jgi:uncharacterized protein
VILLDANILIYAYSATSPFHGAAAEWLENVIGKGEQVGLSWSVIGAFLRITTHPRPLKEVASIATACATIDELLSYSNVVAIEPTASHWNIFKKILIQSQVSRNLVSDADLAALAIEHGAAICTNDKDFTRFAGLKIINPLAKQ